MDLNLCLVLQAFVAPNIFAQLQNELFAFESVNFFINPCIRWDGAALGK